MEHFHLERFFAAHEFTTPHLLAVSDCESTTVSELMGLEPEAEAGLGSLRLGYTESAGHAELRAAVASHHPGLSADDVLVHSAGVEVLFTACHALVDPGDEVVVQTPCYQALRTAPALAGGRVLPWPAHVGEGRWEWSDDELDELLSRPAVRLLVVNTPHNPTGRHVDVPTLRAILQRAREAGVRVLVDEAYAGTELDGVRRPTAAELDPTAATLGLVSKGMGLPGLRIGWLLSRDHELLDAAARVKDHTTICAPAPAEYLATLALRHRDALLARTRRILERNRQRLASFMARHRDLFVEMPPEAGSICFPRTAPGAPLTAVELCRRARDEAGVLLAPGVLFGAAPPDRVGPPVADAFRVGFGRESFSEALAAFERWLARAVER